MRSQEQVQALEKHVDEILNNIKILSRRISLTDAEKSSGLATREDYRLRVVDYCREVVEKRLNVKDAAMPYTLLLNHLKAINREFEEMASSLESIESASRQAREVLLSQLLKECPAEQTVVNLDRDLRVFESDAALHLENARRKMDQNLEASTKHVAEIEAIRDKAISDIREIEDKELILNARSRFTSMVKRHERQECKWLGVFFLSAFATAASVIWSTYTISNTNAIDIAQAVVRVVVILAAGSFTMAFWRKYNLERNLAIIYRHRHAVLKQYESYLGQIEGDRQDQFRIEIAKVIFSDPVTGMTKLPSDFSFNPFLRALKP